MQENSNSSNFVSELLEGENSRRAFMSEAGKIGGSALALSALGSGAVAASGDGDSGDASASVTFENQDSDGTSVTVKSATVPEGGFVAIHDARLLEGEVLDSVIGVSELLDAGDHQDIEVTLFDVPGGDFDQSALQETQPLIPMPHLNTNDEDTYDFVSSGGEADGPYTKAGAAVVGLGFVVVQS